MNEIAVSTMNKVVILVSVLACSILESSGAKQPNIVFILANDYGWNDIGYHGSEIKTPNLDSLRSIMLFPSLKQCCSVLSFCVSKTTHKIWNIHNWTNL